MKPYQRTFHRGMATLLRNTLVDRATLFPSKNALRCAPITDLEGSGDNEWTQAYVAENSGAVGNGLLELAKSGDAIVSSIGCSVERVCLQQGAAAAGMRLADCGPGITVTGLKTLLKSQGARVLVVAPEQLSVVYEAFPELKAVSNTTSKVLELKEFPALKYILQIGRRPANGTHRFKDVLVYDSLCNDIDMKPEMADIPFLIDCNANNGEIIRELTQRQVLTESEENTKKFNISLDSTVLFKSKTNCASNLCIATLSCMMNNAYLIVPSEVFDSAKAAAAKEKNECNAEFG